MWSPTVPTMWSPTVPTWPPTDTTTREYGGIEYGGLPGKVRRFHRMNHPDQTPLLANPFLVADGFR